MVRGRAGQGRVGGDQPFDGSGSPMRDGQLRGREIANEQLVTCRQRGSVEGEDDLTTAVGAGLHDLINAAAHATRIEVAVVARPLTELPDLHQHREAGRTAVPLANPTGPGNTPASSTSP